MQRDEEDPQDCCHHSLHLNHSSTFVLNHLSTFSSLLTKFQNMDLNLAQRSLSLCLILTNLRFFPQTQIPWTSSAPHPRLLLLLNPEEKQVTGIRFNAFLLQLISGKKSLPPSPWQTLLCPPSPERGQLLRSDDTILFYSSPSHPPMTQVLLPPPQKNSVDTGRVRSQLGPGPVRPPKHFPPQLTSTNNKKVAQNFHSPIISTLIHNSSLISHFT